MLRRSFLRPVTERNGLETETSTSHLALTSHSTLIMPLRDYSSLLLAGAVYRLRAHHNKPCECAAMIEAAQHASRVKLKADPCPVARSKPTRSVQNTAAFTGATGRDCGLWAAFLAAKHQYRVLAKARHVESLHDPFGFRSDGYPLPFRFTSQNRIRAPVNKHSEVVVAKPPDAFFSLIGRVWRFVLTTQHGSPNGPHQSTQSNREGNSFSHS